jgi:hypothetical protein
VHGELADAGVAAGLGGDVFPILGTTHVQRLRESLGASEIDLTWEEEKAIWRTRERADVRGELYPEAIMGDWFVETVPLEEVDLKTAGLGFVRLWWEYAKGRQRIGDYVLMGNICFTRRCWQVEGEEPRSFLRSTISSLVSPVMAKGMPRSPLHHGPCTVCCFTGYASLSRPVSWILALNHDKSHSLPYKSKT